MDYNLIKRLVKLVESSEVTELELEEDNQYIRISKKVKTQAVAYQPQFPVATQQIQSSQSKEVEVEAKTTPKEESKANVHEVLSPMVGTFYRAPAPDADSYVKVGDSVSAGSILCIVEAMKLMNEIESDVSGKIVKILVENGKPVEYNQPLFLIQTN
ncbi:MAG TPA: acetyl-CoA carboxylase biotin carboxyl carrier protein [Ignavibacteriaceae bacterium]|nr:acetyl-CoA carboxylase biotin carboxyl carrier protein [Ignavibacteriaceae bacterium]